MLAQSPFSRPAPGEPRRRTGATLGRGSCGTAAPGAQEASLAYAGQHWDADLGLSYAQQRWYDPGTGRFLSEDPMFGDPRSPGSLLVFAYANGNPLTFVDPLGEAAKLFQQDVEKLSREEKEQAARLVDAFWAMDAAQPALKKVSDADLVNIICVNVSCETGDLAYAIERGKRYLGEKLGPVVDQISNSPAANALREGSRRYEQGKEDFKEAIGDVSKQAFIDATSVPGQSAPNKLQNATGDAVKYVAEKGTGLAIELGENAATDKFAVVVVGGVIKVGRPGVTALEESVEGVVDTERALTKEERAGRQLVARAEKAAPLTDEVTHGHHTYPKALGGHPKQKLADLIESAHTGTGGVHSDLAQFEGGWLRPRKGMTGAQIVEEYGQEEVEKGLRRFYSQKRWKHLLPTFEKAVKFTHESGAGE